MEARLKPAEPAAPLKLWLFGKVRAEYGGIPVRAAPRPQCAVLFAMLAVRPGARLARKTLAAELWPDERDFTRANGNLRRHLSALQASLPPLPDGETWIDSDGATLAWSGSRRLWCDVAEFEKALTDPEAAPEAFARAGDFMTGYTNDWVVAQREDFRARAIERLLALCVERQDDDRLDEALACAVTILEMDPLREEAVALAIELHGERGDPVSAGQMYAAFTERLRREVDAAPAASTVATMERVRSAANSRRDRLPAALTTFVGRRGAVAGLESALAQHRCVTIAGPGGAGKTRLSLETALSVAHRFPDGSYFIDLSSAPAGGEVVAAVIRALELPVELARSDVEGVRRFLRNRRALLILDNCEHVRDACAAFAAGILASAPRISILATSRLPLGIGAELLYRLAPLSQSEAHVLFVERTRSGGADAVWSAAERTSIDRICTLLDRSPLAIELAAGLCSSMALPDIERLLPQRLAMLASSDPSRPERHRTLEATIAWSYELLEPAERRLFTRLAVFPASFTFDAALEICGEGPAAVRGLVEKSMLQRDETSAGRYRLLYSLADFARARFDSLPGAPAVRDAHARRFAELAFFGESIDTPEFFRGEARWLRELNLELENVRAALAHLLEGPSDGRDGLRMACALERFFAMHGYFAEGAAWLERARIRAIPGSRDDVHVRYKLARFASRRGAQREALAVMEETIAYYRAADCRPELAGTLQDAGAIAFLLGDTQLAQRYFSEGLELAERAGLTSVKATLLGNLGILAAASGRMGEAGANFSEAARLFKRVGDRRFLARMLANMAAHEYFAGRYAESLELSQEALDIAETLGAVLLAAGVRCDMGEALLAAGDLERARDEFGRALATFAPLGLPHETGHALLGFAGIAAASGDARRAARLAGAAAAFVEHDVRTRFADSLYQRVKRAGYEALGEAEFERQRRLGELLELEVAIALANGESGLPVPAEEPQHD